MRDSHQSIWLLIAAGCKNKLFSEKPLTLKTGRAAATVTNEKYEESLEIDCKSSLH
jgi:hypothetical protein